MAKDPNYQGANVFTGATARQGDAVENAVRRAGAPLHDGLLRQVYAQLPDTAGAGWSNRQITDAINTALAMQGLPAGDLTLVFALPNETLTCLGSGSLTITRPTQWMAPGARLLAGAGALACSSQMPNMHASANLGGGGSLGAIAVKIP